MGNTRNIDPAPPTTAAYTMAGHRLAQSLQPFCEPGLGQLSLLPASILNDVFVHATEDRAVLMQFARVNHSAQQFVQKFAATVIASRADLPKKTNKLSGSKTKKSFFGHQDKGLSDFERNVGSIMVSASHVRLRAQGESALNSDDISLLSVHAAEAMEDWPRWFFGYEAMAEVFVSLGDYTGAARFFSQAAALCKPHQEASRLRCQGHAVFFSANKENALEIYRKYIALEDKSPEVRCRIGELVATQNQLSEAEAHHHAAIRLRPTYPEGWLALGCTLAALQRYDDAEQAMRKAMTLRKSYATAYRALGVMKIRQKQFGEAAKLLRVAVDLQPNNPDALAPLGEALTYLKKYGEAEVCYQTVLKHDANNAEARLGLAFTQYAQRRFEEAKQNALCAINLRKDWAQAQRLYEVTCSALKS